MIHNEDDKRTLLERMRGLESDEYAPTPADISALVESFAVRMFTDSPLFAPANLTCQVDRVDGGWDLKLRRK